MAVALTDMQVQDVRARICAVAERQFATLGLAATSIRSIAREMGWTGASIYRYFRNKNELLSATRAAALDRFSDLVNAAYDSPGDLWSRSRAINQAYMDFAFSEPAAYKLIFAFEQPSDEKTPELVAAEARSQRTLTTYVEDMVGAGLLVGDPNVLAHVYWAAMHGLVVLEMAEKLKRAPPFETIRHEMLRLITNGASPTGRSRS